MSASTYSPTPRTEAQMMETLGQARTLLVGLRHFAANPDTPLQRHPEAYLRWLKSLGSSRALAGAVAPIWGPAGMGDLLDTVYPPEIDPVNSEAPFFEALPKTTTATDESPAISRKELIRQNWESIDPALLDSLRAAIESQGYLRVHVTASVDQDLFVKIRRQRGGITTFIAKALEEFLSDPEAVFAASARLAERRSGSASKPTISGRVAPELAERVDAVVEAFKGKVARVTSSKVVGGCVMLLAEKRMLRAESPIQA